MTSEMVVRLGIIGLSEGNGHPYSWSAIINGYDARAMADCPFPAIPAYLAEHSFPHDRLTGASVTHVWTQDPELSAHVARAALIAEVAGDYRDMLGKVDAVLLARDDAENHVRYAEPFLEAGVPVYIDKPPALSLRQLDELFALARSAEQIFSCSALRFASELQLAPEEASRLGEVREISGVVPRSWQKYAVHAIDPIVSFLQPGRVRASEARAEGAATTLSISWENGRTGSVLATGAAHDQIALTYRGERAIVRKVFTDSFTAFRSALRCFLDGVRHRRSATSYAHLRDVVELIELGMRALRSPEPESFGRSRR